MPELWKHFPGGLIAAAVLALSATVGWAAANPPETVQLNALAQLYDEVEFDHALHTSMVEDCATCHHHTTGSAPLNQECTHCHAGGKASAKVACSDCHAKETFSAQYLREKDLDVARYHRDKLGLKGAYHQACMGCHREMGGPLGCQDCHALNETGEAFYHTGNFAPVGGEAAVAGHD